VDIEHLGSQGLLPARGKDENSESPGDRKTGKLLGAQIIGAYGTGVSKPHRHRWLRPS